MDFVCPIRSAKIIYRSIIRERYVRDSTWALCARGIARAVIRSSVRARHMQGAVGLWSLSLNEKAQPARGRIICVHIKVIVCVAVTQKADD